MTYCKDCEKVFTNDSKFCIYCGKKTTPGGERKFRHSLSVLYGPPYSVKYVCRKCGNVYIEHGLGSPHAPHCPECGTKNRPVDED